MGTRRVVNVRWTSYLGPSDVNYVRTPSGRKISTSYKRNFWTNDRRSFFVGTILERSKDVLIQKFFEHWILTSFGRMIFDMTNHDCWLNVVSNVDWTSELTVPERHSLNISWPGRKPFYRKWNKTAWFSEKVKIGLLKVCPFSRA